MSVASEALSGVHKSELLLFFTLLQLCVIVLAGRIGANLALRWGQSAAVGEIIIGIILGPTLFGWLWPDAFNFVFRSTPGDAMQILSQIGLILLMFQIGMEFEFSHLAEKEHRRSVTRIAVASMVVPFGLGYALGYWMTPVLTPQANPTAAALFVGTAFSITALPILGRMLIESDIARKPLGVGARRVGMRAAHPQHVEHRALRREHGAAADRADEADAQAVVEESSADRTRCALVEERVRTEQGHGQPGELLRRLPAGDLGERGLEGGGSACSAAGVGEQAAGGERTGRLQPGRDPAELVASV